MIVQKQHILGFMEFLPLSCRKLRTNICKHSRAICWTVVLSLCWNTTREAVEISIHFSIFNLGRLHVQKIYMIWTLPCPRKFQSYTRLLHCYHIFFWKHSDLHSKSLLSILIIIPFGLLLPLTWYFVLVLMYNEEIIFQFVISTHLLGNFSLNLLFSSLENVSCCLFSLLLSCIYYFPFSLIYWLHRPIVWL